ncbi:bifunctional 2-C-methyl-D-erythritol 4-phosphate cytidylyltransferase/2-C-methyl-D-erythritol 2,4-cyclodiphosphate synthase [Thalassococcus sp. S3]|uniref:bifunctional 2-C-methyl-D-erythritol 4-phosphate cytidylyltransferase/2-C-methyl-D-erythritol 2,4-cyclodiphosphate synthase n=1 Tax=Thalassococcus sp. S3 TaxID=2017482 RepID=UPI00102446EF|nr:bifunctional 2-C-methyl-D-erythritol 4-phosphate cytidylyltransferase/2-C-methyl-D-erythritol 2,4-cyclodiphosphate synthase [Thalassococcus sp. S3]QBF31734.1 bifunctional 2-C-methyl-D-erythritol 4-phosphate cytidylyltransferase/2-C-methyl-D-erythritol 2,4-cyclodiphosphate synthase [Thalassococcus sp. S3]
MSVAAIIVAAGRGERAGGAIAKQWQVVAGRRVIDWTVQRFLNHPDISHIVLVLPENDPKAATAFKDLSKVICTTGGQTRMKSVNNGLQALAGERVSKVLIHDVARPCVPDQVIADVLDALDKDEAAAPGLAVSDALWHGDAGTVQATRDRTGLFAAQTPQGFAYHAIRAAHDAFDGEAADDVEVARAAGLEVRIVPGHPDNLKITRPEDFARAARILEEQMDIRLGNGYDVHRFTDGDHVVLCGVKIPHDRSLDGHSDADVGMHAVTDAVYGALAEGDIGRHFPPSDPQWKGAASEIFLRHAVQLARDRGFEISNVDCTLVCEFPKIGPHSARMQSQMADLMAVDERRVSIKATTSERLGFTGRGEGIAALATVALVSR